MNRAVARPETVRAPTNELQAITTGEHNTARIDDSALRRGTSADAIFAPAAADLPGSGLEGKTTFGGTGKPSAADLAALIISAADIPAAATGADFAAAVAAGLPAGGADEVAAGAAAPALARIAAMMSAGLFGAAAPAAGDALAPCFFTAARIPAVSPGASAAAFAPAGFAAARAAARMSAVAFGATGVSAAGDAASADSAGAGFSPASDSPAPAGGEPAFARILARMSFVEGFGSVIQLGQPSERNEVRHVTLMATQHN